MLVSICSLWTLASASQSQQSRAPKAPSFEYLGNYPSDRSTGWSNELQGVAHDRQNWFFAQTSKLWKFPLSHDLNQRVSQPDAKKGILRATIPSSLAKLRYDHFGDLDCIGGLLFVPLEGSVTPAVRSSINPSVVIKPEIPAPPPRIAVFRASNLAFVGSYVLTGQRQAGWNALRSETDGLYLYTSNNVINSSNPVFRYKVDISKIETKTDSAFRPMPSVALYKGKTPLSIKPYLQGGEFSEDGAYLFLTNGKGSDFNSADGGIWVFGGAPGMPLQFIEKSSTNKRESSLFFEFHPGGFPFGGKKFEEPEGITFWDIEAASRGTRIPGAPKVGGQLHVILLDNELLGDDIYIKHYRMRSR